MFCIYLQATSEYFLNWLTGTSGSAAWTSEQEQDSGCLTRAARWRPGKGTPSVRKGFVTLSLACHFAV